MKVDGHEPDLASLDRLTDVEALCVFVGEDERPLRGVAGYVDWRLCGALSRVLVSEFFSGGAGDCLLLPANGRLAIPRIFVCGVGPSAQLKDAVGGLMTSAADRLTRAKIRSVAVEVPSGEGLPDAERARLVRERFLPKFKGDRVALLVEKGVSKLL